MSENNIHVSDYVDVTQQAKALDCNVPAGVTILPRNFDTATSKDQLYHEDTTSSMKKILKNAGIELTPLEKEEKFGAIQEHDLSWAGPLLYFPAAICAENPELIVHTITTIANFLKDFVGGLTTTQKAKLSVVTETKSGKFRKIDYKGPIEGLDKIPDIVRSTYDSE